MIAELRMLARAALDPLAPQLQRHEGELRRQGDWHADDHETLDSLLQRLVAIERHLGFVGQRATARVARRRPARLRAV